MPRRISPLAVAQAFARIAAVAIIVMGVAVGFGWAFDISLLKRVLPGLVAMKINTALAFIAAGVALYALVGRATVARTRFARIAAALVIVIGAATIAEYVTDTTWGTDELLHRDDPQGVLALHPGRMALCQGLCQGHPLCQARGHPPWGRRLRGRAGSDNADSVAPRPCECCLSSRPPRLG